MARTFYLSTGGVAAAVSVDDGDYEPASAIFDVYDAPTGGTQLTSLSEDSAGTSPITQVAPDPNTIPQFWGPDGETGTLWLEDAGTPGSQRIMALPSDIADRATGGASDHGALTGLSDDDHAQYHNNTRGDARYYTKAEVDARTPAASETVAGLVERATEAEVATGTDTTRYVPPALLTDKLSELTITASQVSDVNFDDFAVVSQVPIVIRYGATPPNRSVASTDPDQPVWWQGENPPTLSGTGSTGAVVGDLYTAGVFV